MTSAIVAVVPPEGAVLCGVLSATSHHPTEVGNLLHRAEGGCTKDYLEDDLAHVRCMVCGRRGHLSCQVAQGLERQHPSCFNCGDGGHVATECWKVRKHSSI